LTARLLIVIGCAVAALAALAPAAGAAPAPSCSSSEIWSRPGLERQHRIACEDTDAVVLVGAPQHGRLAGFRWDGETRTGRSRPRRVRPRPTRSSCS
jgi:hypothetical protein